MRNGSRQRVQISYTVAPKVIEIIIIILPAHYMNMGFLQLKQHKTQLNWVLVGCANHSCQLKRKFAN